MSLEKVTEVKTKSETSSKTFTVGNVRLRGRKTKHLDVYTSSGWIVVCTHSDVPGTPQELRQLQRTNVDQIYEKYKGKTIITKDGHDIKLSKKGLNHVGNGPKRFGPIYRFYLIKSVLQVKEIIENAVLLYEDTHKTGSPDCKIFIFRSIFTSEDGYEINVRITVKKHLKNEKSHYDHYFILE